MAGRHGSGCRFRSSFHSVQQQCRIAPVRRGLKNPGPATGSTACGTTGVDGKPESTDVQITNLAGQGTTPEAKARLFWDQQRRHWSVYVNNLPPAPANRSYQLWFVPKAGNPVSAGVFNTEANGSAVVEADVPAGLDLMAAAVTTEPAGGLPQPTGPFALLGALDLGALLIDSDHNFAAGPVVAGFSPRSFLEKSVKP